MMSKDEAWQWRRARPQTAHTGTSRDLVWMFDGPGPKRPAVPLYFSRALLCLANDDTPTRTTELKTELPYMPIIRYDADTCA